MRPLLSVDPPPSPLETTVRCSAGRRCSCWCCWCWWFAIADVFAVVDDDAVDVVVVVLGLLVVAFEHLCTVVVVAQSHDNNCPSPRTRAVILVTALHRSLLWLLLPTPTDDKVPEGPLGHPGRAARGTQGRAGASYGGKLHHWSGFWRLRAVRVSAGLSTGVAPQ